MQTYPTGYAESHHIAEQIFREILPRHGMAVREEQIALCHEVLDTLYNKEISLCEAGVGTGKTLAYLVGCILWQMNRPERMKLPIVISTSSVALQDAILTEYLPDLSAVLLDEGIITAPITAVVRKGKERFVCDARLAERASLVQPSRKRQTNSLNIAAHILDMDHIPELSRYDRCRICVPQSCPRDCFMRLDCRYQQYLRDSMKPDIQICNHNYLLADASHRLEDRPLLLRSYQALVVDEAHKLPDAARQMYTETLSSRAMDELCLLLQQAHYKDFARQLRTAFLTLSFSCTQGLSKLRGKASEPFVLTPFRRAALIDCIALLQKYWRIAGCAAIPAEQAGRSRKSPAPFSFGGADAHPLHRLRCRWSAYILRSQQPRTAVASQCTVEHPRTSNSDLRHTGSSRRFQPHGTAFGAGGLPTSASFPRRFSV